MSEILEKLKKNENITKVLIILISIIITFVFIILLDKTASSPNAWHWGLRADVV